MWVAFRGIIIILCPKRIGSSSTTDPNSFVEKNCVGEYAKRWKKTRRKKIDRGLVYRSPPHISLMVTYHVISSRNKHSIVFPIYIIENSDIYYLVIFSYSLQAG